MQGDDGEPLLGAPALKTLLGRSKVSEEHWLSDDARSLIDRCSRTFIKTVVEEAEKRAKEEKRSVLTPAHVVAALESQAVGCNAIATTLRTDHADLIAAKQQRSKGGGKSKGGADQPSEQELIKLQNELFARSRANISGQASK